MSLYYFNFTDGREIDDAVGTELADLRAAKAEAVNLLSAMLHTSAAAQRSRPGGAGPEADRRVVGAALCIGDWSEESVGSGLVAAGATPAPDHPRVLSHPKPLHSRGRGEK